MTKLNRKTIDSITSIIVGLSLILAIGCTREPNLRDAHNNNSDGSKKAMSFLQNKTCTVETTDEVLIKLGNGQDEAKKKIVKSDNFKFFDVVDFKTDCPYLNISENKQAAEFLGDKNKTYKIKIIVNKDYVIYNKVVSLSEMSHLEKPFALKQGDKDEYLVPFGGFAVSAFANKIRMKDAEGDKINILDYVSVSWESKPKYVIFNHLSFMNFDNELRAKNIFPANYFDGEWHYTNTVLNARVGANSGIGLIDGVSGRFGSSVKFEVGQNSLSIISTTRDESIETENELDLRTLMNIQAKPIAYRLQGNSDLSLKIEELKDASHDLRKSVQVNFLNITDLAGGSRSNNFNREDKRDILHELEIEDDFLAFIVSDGQTGITTRYAFARKKPVTDENLAYDKKIAYIDDITDYSYLGTARKLRSADYLRTMRSRKALEESYFAIRYNPKKDIVVNFSKATPQDDYYRDIGRQSMKLIEYMFDYLKVKIKKDTGQDVAFPRVYLDESIDRYNGDPRAQVIVNLINGDDNRQFGAKGVANAYVDYETGELLSSVANVYLRRDGTYARFRDHIWQNVGLSNIKNLDDDVLNRFGNNPRLIKGKSATNTLKETLDFIVKESLYINGEGEHLQPFPVVRWSSQSQSSIVLPFKNKYIESLSDEELADLFPRFSYRPIDDDFSQERFYHTEHSHQLLTYREKFIDRVEDEDKNMFKHANAVHTFECDHSKEEAIAFGSSDQNPAMEKFINARCPKVVKYITKIKETGLIEENVEDENAILKDCVDKWTQVDYLRTTTHEILHALGAHHKYGASIDVANFMPAEKINHLLDVIDFSPFDKLDVCPSVMDYMDIAQIRDYSCHLVGRQDFSDMAFLYADMVEEDLALGENDILGKLTKVSTDMSIDQWARKENFSRRKYKPCSDPDLAGFIDPECRPYDYGRNSLEVIQHELTNLLYTLKKYTNLHSTPIKARQLDLIKIRSMTSIPVFVLAKTYYDKWRELLNEYIGGANPKKYLEGISIKEYEGIVKEMITVNESEANDSDIVAKKQTYKEHFQARNLFVKVLIRLSMLPNRYCVVSADDEGEERELIELSKIKTALSQAEGYAGEYVESCFNPLVSDDYLQEQGLKLIGQVGYDNFGGSHKLQENQGMNPLSGIVDYVGVGDVKLQAMGMLTARMTLSRKNVSAGFTPSMLDEPDIRSAVTNVVYRRLLDGVRIPDPTSLSDISKLANTNLISFQKDFKDLVSGPSYKVFRDEMGMIASQYLAIVNGLSVPGDPDETKTRRDPFLANADYAIAQTANRTGQLPQQVRGKSQIFEPGDQAVITADNTTNFVSARLMAVVNGYKEQKRSKEIFDSNPDSFNKLTQEELVSLSEELDAFLIEKGIFNPNSKQPVRLSVVDVFELTGSIQKAVTNKTASEHLAAYYRKVIPQLPAIPIQALNRANQLLQQSGLQPVSFPEVLTFAKYHGLKSISDSMNEFLETDTIDQDSSTDSTDEAEEEKSKEVVNREKRETIIIEEFLAKNIAIPPYDKAVSASQVDLILKERSDNAAVLEQFVGRKADEQRAHEGLLTNILRSIIK